jgi:RNA polymerase sporulation-specific sigma factor
MGKVQKVQQKIQGHDNAQLVECVNKVRNGDDEDAFKHISKQLDSYMRHLCSKFFVPGHNSDDVYQECLYALSTKAIPDYCEEKGGFLGFAKLCIRRHIITVLKAANNNKNKALNTPISLDATANDNDDGPVPISVLIPADGENVVVTFVKNEAHERLKALLLKELTPLESNVLELYLQSMSYMDIVATINKKKRGKNRVKPKVIDNALCRIKKKASEIETNLGEEDEDDDLWGSESSYRNRITRR